MRSIILIFASCLFPTILLAQLTLTIEIEELRNDNGKLLLEFNNENEEILKGFSEKITDKKCTIVVKDLETGTYAFKYFHDENDDEKINTNFVGIPKEGFGFSNNAKGTFGPPSFKKMLFELTKSDTVKCTPSYMLKQN